MKSSRNIGIPRFLVPTELFVPRSKFSQIISVNNVQLFAVECLHSNSSCLCFMCFIHLSSPLPLPLPLSVHSASNSPHVCPLPNTLAFKRRGAARQSLFLTTTHSCNTKPTHGQSPLHGGIVHARHRTRNFASINSARRPVCLLQVSHGPLEAQRPAPDQPRRLRG